MPLLPPFTLRPRTNPLPLLNPNGRVSIYRPKVSSGLPILEFNAFPSAPGSDLVGVPVGVVLDACFVLAGNKQGELHFQQNRVAGHDSDPNALLAPGQYAFFVVRPGGELDDDYSLCESFSAWTPPVSIPARWLGGEAAYAPPPPGISAVSTAVIMYDERCIMTGACTAIQASHIVPKTEDAWFDFHFRVLEGYGGDPCKDLTSVRNEVTLRADIIKVFDEGLFLFAPYANDVIAVFVQEAAQDLAYEYHLRAVNFPSRIRRGYLFIRFAWNIFNFCAPGLAASARMRSPQARPECRKRKRSKDSKQGGRRAGGANNRQDIGCGTEGDSDEDVLPPDDGKCDSNAPTYHRDEASLAVFEILDEALKTRPLTVDDVEVGRYPGYSKIKRLEYEYRRAHPEVSAVGSARFWEEGDIDE